MIHLLLTMFLAQAPQPAADQNMPTCTLEGQVFSASTGAPLKHATLRLNPIMQGITQQETRTAYTSSTDAEGKFVMQRVAAGTYTLRADRAGYIGQFYGARSASAAGPRLKLDDGQSMKDLVFKLVPQAMIFGKVIDDDGEPVASARIQLQRWAWVNGKKQLRPGGAGSSQADGTFVIGNLAAGRYYLSADATGNRMSGVIEQEAGKTPADGFLMTYYPNVLDISSAAPIQVSAGAELRGVEIHLRRGRTYEIRGHVENNSGAPAPQNVNLILLPKTGDMTVFSARNQAFTQGRNLQFQFKNVLPGSYVIQTQFAQSSVTDPATGDATRSTQLTGRMEITVSDANIDKLVFPIGPGLEIVGHVTTEGNPPPQSSQQPFSVSLRPPNQAVFYGPMPYGQASSEGNFRLHTVAPDVYEVFTYGNPDGTYVKSIRFAGQDVTGKTLDLTSGAGGDLEIVISPNAADVSGTVRNENGEAVSGVAIQIFRDDKMEQNHSTDQNGAFHFTSLAPGKYQIYAWEDIEAGMSQDPDFRKNFESKATTVKLEEKGHESVEVKLISKDAIETEAAKIR
jgi:hypothetical protein